MIKIYNSLSGKKEEFKPIKKGEVLLYVCGITAYDSCHLGHLRVALNFDIVVRYLRHQGYKVKYVRNITDIDDKIIHKAQEQKTDFLNISRLYSDEMHDEFSKIELDKPDFEPRATAYVKEMIAMIKNLEDRDMTYLTANGDLCYRVRKFSDYGKLSGKKIDELRPDRIAPDETKEDPLDFVLWKSAKENEPWWDSPWGKGRPGWHIECSAMVRSCLGTSIDIHGGGRDLLFPHHENEIAQSEACTDHTLANYWMHCASVMIGGKKMSKSLNNFISIKDLLQHYHPEVIRYVINASHYRSQMDYKEELMEQSKNALDNIYRTLAYCTDIFSSAEISDIQENFDNSIESLGLVEKEQAFYAAMDDDFNTPLAISVLFELVKILKTDKKNKKALHSLIKLGNILGLLKGMLKQDISLHSGSGISEELTKRIEELVAQRSAARDNKDWDKSDQLRDELSSLGVSIEDTADGTKWRLNK